MSHSNNVYVKPEAFGLQQISEIDMTSGYNFDKYVLWRHEDGSFWFGHDAGCSCPSPFENFLGLHHLTRVFNVREVYELVEQNQSDYRKVPYSTVEQFAANAVGKGLWCSPGENVAPS